MLIGIYLLEILFFVGLLGSTVVLVLSFIDDAHTAVDRSAGKPSPRALPQAEPSRDADRQPQPA